MQHPSIQKERSLSQFDLVLFFCKGWEGAAYMSSETVFTAVVGIVFLNDPASWRFFAVALFIVGSGLALSKLGQ